ncbi:MAG: hypothetical protein IPL59_14300 [Candidatus Competibacteraceae bacterium]|nr:hypothetical protein [Candidatus Competibacteraceae bacterium]
MHDVTCIAAFVFHLPHLVVEFLSAFSDQVVNATSLIDRWCHGTARIGRPATVRWRAARASEVNGMASARLERRVCRKRCREVMPCYLVEFIRDWCSDLEPAGLSIGVVELMLHFSNIPRPA